MSEGPSATHVSLLLRLRAAPADQSAWAEFVDRYGPKVYGWCRRWGLQEADARDVTQDVLLTLARKLPEFRYDPSRSFRAWLKTLAHHALVDHARARHRPGVGAGEGDARDLLQSLEARVDLARRVEEAFDAELFDEAVARVRQRVEPQTWEAFRLTALEGLSGAEAAARVPMRVAQVYVAKRRVQNLLREEVRSLERLGGV